MMVDTGIGAPSERVYTCDVAVIGGGMGGVAAALAAVEAGASVVLTEATDWLGGQMTAQCVSALDEHPYIETFGGTRAYYRLREAIRAYYRQRYEPVTGDKPLNPGSGWVTRFCFEPHVALQAIEDMLAPHVESGKLTILLQHVPTAAQVANHFVTEVTMRAAHGNTARIQAAYFLDATELGDLLPLTGTAYVTGIEAQADTGEAHASPTDPCPDEVQAFTYSFAVDYQPDGDYTIPKPPNYEAFRDAQPYSLALVSRDGTQRRFPMFAGDTPFWTYRRIFDRMLLAPNGSTPDIAVINAPGSDYYRENLIDRTPEEQARILAEAKQLALGFLYWLQTEAPREDGSGTGFPGLRLRFDITGTSDGFSKTPYIRESRRIVPLKRVVETDIAGASNSGARAVSMVDSVGVGWHPIEIHARVGNPSPFAEPTRPFQIPLGALIPRETANLIAACKNIGTTHVTNGAYRVHPVEWNVGESAGTLAAYCCAHDLTPKDIWSNLLMLRRFQYALILRGIPLAWTVDVPASHPQFIPSQIMMLDGVIGATSDRFLALDVQPGQPIDAYEAANFREALGIMSGNALVPLTDSGWFDRVLMQGDIRAWLEQALQDVGMFEHAPLSEPPTWGDLCLIIAPLIERALAQPTG
jgi:hypothetical protein